MREAAAAGGTIDNTTAEHINKALRFYFTLILYNDYPNLLTIT